MTELNIVTFNIRCFGSDGDYFGKMNTESRIPFLKNFLDSNFHKTDVFVFQEIMDPLFLNQILPTGFKTYTYQHDYERHMFIVLACRAHFEIEDFQTIPGTSLDTNTSRPAVYGKLVFNKSPILDIIGVHLKSKYDHTESRKKQVLSISEFIRGLPQNRPKVMTGDFNSHSKEQTLLEQDDLTDFEDILDNQMTLANHNQPTYLSASDVMKLDHFFVQGVKVSELKVYDLPDYSSTGSFRKYFDEISDHLPVSVKIQLRTD